MKDVKVYHKENELQDPHVLQIRLISRSRGDIPSSAFDQGRPLILDVGIPIVAQLSLDENLGEPPEMRIEGNTLKIGPDLIRKGKKFTFTILADGRDARLSCDAHLVNVKVGEQPSAQAVSRRVVYLPSVVFIVIAYILLVILILTNSNSAILNAAIPVFFGIAAFFLFIVDRIIKRRYTE
jgi:hypothetical protein